MENTLNFTQRARLNDVMTPLDGGSWNIRCSAEMNAAVKELCHKHQLKPTVLVRELIRAGARSEFALELDNANAALGLCDQQAPSKNEQ